MNEIHPADELDVREILRAIRAEVSAPTQESAEPSSVTHRDLEILRSHHDVRQYDLSTERSLGPLVVGAKKLVEAVVRPYAGHFLDKQAHFNAALQRVVSQLLSQLEGINQQLATIQKDQQALQQLIRNDMDDLRTRLERLRGEMAQRHQSLHTALHAGLEEQERLFAEREAATSNELQATAIGLHHGLSEAVDRLQARLSDVEKKSLESQKDMQDRLSKEIAAVVDFIEEVLPVL
ncbi:hypothetical protein JXA88_00325 [Candidatus Fermentibacteria bacterium]|nr:hypothetical protein [Candidatus Fermentibacteria bacterium]